MDTPSPIPGFITRKEASENCKRAERTLQRYWSRAIEHRDDKVLDHLKLRTEDGEVIEGTGVTKDLIEKLKRERRNPTWYVRASWVEKTYGPRLEASRPKDNDPTGQHAVGESDRPTSSSADPEIATLLKEQITNLRQDKHDLREELKIKNDQIKEASERDRETHVLMRDLHELLRDMQKRLPSPADASFQSESRRIVDVKETASDTRTQKSTGSSLAKKGSARKKTVASKSKTKKRKSKKKTATTIWQRPVSDFLPFRTR